jgi:competence protein ComEC
MWKSLAAAAWLSLAAAGSAWAGGQPAAPHGAAGHDATEIGTTASGAYLIHVVDVGTGLAVFVEGPDFNLIYDGGSNDDEAIGPDNRFVAYLKRVRPNLTHIDHVILSHPHNDHVLLLADVIKTYDVGQVWDSGRMYKVCSYHAFLEAISEKPGIVYHQVTGGPGKRTIHFPASCDHKQPYDLTLKRGAQITAQPTALGAGGAMTILYRDDKAYPDPNENSLVTRLDLGGVRILLTGDEEGGERELPTAAPDPGSPEARLLDCCKADLKADIQFAGHHGSMTSSRQAFVDAVGAKMFIISSGPMLYGHVTLPDSVIRDELKARGELWETYLNDATCKTNPAKIGPDNDGKAGGCDNVVITIKDGVASAQYFRPVD